VNPEAQRIAIAKAKAALGPWEVIDRIRCERDEIRAQLREEQQLHTQTLNERDELAGYLCRIKLPLSVRFVANLADVFPGKNVRMKDVDGYLCIFSVNAITEGPAA